MTMLHDAGLSQLRDQMALAICRRLVAGEPLEDWMLDDFAQADAEAGFWLDDDGPARPGASFGL